MGNVEAKNEVDSAISASVSIMNSSTQKCRTSLDQDQSINVSGCTHVNIEHVDFGAGGTVDIKCAQDASSTTAIKQQISTRMQQMSKAVNQALDFNPGSSEASNIVRLSEDLSTAVVTSYSQSCLPSVSQNQSVNVKCPTTGGSTANIEFIDFREFNNSLVTCTQTTSSVNQVAQSIKTIIEQRAIAKVAPIFSLGVIIIILIILGLVAYYFSSGKISSVIIVLILGAIILTIMYMILAVIFKWWPFKHE
ncbi:hypothetical protein BH23THE1_BH23THE1_26380 [soil metagenome]